MEISSIKATDMRAGVILTSYGHTIIALMIKYKGLQSNVLYATTESLLANADYDRIHSLAR